MTETTTRPFFRADQVGSLLRPQALLEGRTRFGRGEIDRAELRGMEDETIRAVVRQQEGSACRWSWTASSAAHEA